MNKFWIGCCSELLTYGRPWVPMFHDGDRKQGTINTSAVSSTNSTGDGPAEPPVALNNPDFHHPQKPIGFMQALRIPVSRPVCQFCVHLRLVFPIKVLEFLTFFFYFNEVAFCRDFFKKLKCPVSVVLLYQIRRETNIPKKCTAFLTTLEYAQVVKRNYFQV